MRKANKASSQLKLHQTLETWIHDRQTGGLLDQEVADVLESIRAGILDPTMGTNVVAEDLQGNVIGVMGIYPLKESMIQFFSYSLSLRNSFGQIKAYRYVLSPSCHDTCSASK